MLSVVGLSVMMLQSCNYIKEELRNDPIDSIEPIESVESDFESIESHNENGDGIIEVTIDRDFKKETTLTYQVRRAHGHDYMIFVSVYGVAAVHDPNCSCGHAN